MTINILPFSKDLKSFSDDFIISILLDIDRLSDSLEGNEWIDSEIVGNYIFSAGIARDYMFLGEGINPTDIEDDYDVDVMWGIFSDCKSEDDYRITFDLVRRLIRGDLEYNYQQQMFQKK